MAKMSMDGFDAGRFMKDLEHDIMENAKEQALEQEYDVECPHCNADIRLVPGKRLCPKCGETIDFQLNVRVD